METDRQTGDAAATRSRRSSRPTQPAKATAAARTEKIERIDLATLKDMSVGALTKIAKQLDVPGATGMRKQELIFEILQGARREERPDLLRGRARNAARRLRLPARARLQLPARPRRHLRLAVADPEVRSAHRRHRVGPDPAAEGRRALLRADQGRSGQLRAAGAGAREGVLREPDAALPAEPDRRSRPTPRTCRRA